MKHKRLTLLVALSLLLGGCMSGSGVDVLDQLEEAPESEVVETSSLPFDEFESLVQQIVPLCEFETVRAKNGEPFPPDASRGWEYLNLTPLVSGRIDEAFGFYDGEAQITTLFDTDAEGFATFAACHSRSRTLDSKGELGWDFDKFDAEGNQKPVFDEEGKCWWDWGSDANTSFVQGCLDEMSWYDNQGFWVVIREHSSPERAQEHIRRLEADGSSMIGPIFSSGQFTVKIDANWNPMSSSGFYETNNVWFQLQETLPSVQLSNRLHKDYNSWTEQWDKPRDYYREWAAVYGPNSSCSSQLSVSEVDWDPLECGVAVVDVFQADLATGPCAFLGTYVDSSGNEKTGFFRFCNTFQEGSFAEGNSHELRVKVVGETSYQTRGGWEKNVLAFDVVG